MKLFLILSIFSLISFVGLSQTTEYQYDSSGNIISRKVINMTRSAASDENEVMKVQEDILDGISIKVYPNPTKGILNISIPDCSVNDRSRILLFDLSGRMLMNRAATEENTVLDISSFNRGIYIMKIQAGEKFSDWKIIKE